MANVTHLEKVPAPASAGHPAASSTAGAAPAPHAQRVAYGTTALSMEAIKYRDEHRMWGLGNVAVVEYRGPDGRTHTLALPSGDDGHSERRLIDALSAQGVIPPPGNVTSLYTEREPCCLPGANCRSLVEQHLAGVPVSYSFDYGETRENRQAGNAAMDRELDHHRPGDIRSEPGGAVSGVETVTPEQRVAAAEQIREVREHFRDDAHVQGLIDGRAGGKLDSEIEKEMRTTHDVTHKEFLAAKERLAEYREENR